MSATPEVKRQARFYLSHYYPLFEALIHDRDGHLVKFRGSRVVCTTCHDDLGPDNSDQAELEYDRWVRTVK